MHGYYSMFAWRKPLWVPSYMSAPIFQSITDAHSFLVGEGSGSQRRPERPVLMHRYKESHYTAKLVSSGEECSGNQCYSNLNMAQEGFQSGERI